MNTSERTETVVKFQAWHFRKISSFPRSKQPCSFFPNATELKASSGSKIAEQLPLIQIIKWTPFVLKNGLPVVQWSRTWYSLDKWTKTPRTDLVRSLPWLSSPARTPNQLSNYVGIRRIRMLDDHWDSTAGPRPKSPLCNNAAFNFSEYTNLQLRGVF